MKYRLEPYRRVHRAFFADGTVIEAECSRSAWKQHISTILDYMDDFIPKKVWFRPCQAWKDASALAIELYREHYRTDPFIKMLMELDALAEEGDLT